MMVPNVHERLTLKLATYDRMGTPVSPALLSTGCSWSWVHKQLTLKISSYHGIGSHRFRDALLTGIEHKQYTDILK